MADGGLDVSAADAALLPVFVIASVSTAGGMDGFVVVGKTWLVVVDVNTDRRVSTIVEEPRVTVAKNVLVCII